MTKPWIKCARNFYKFYFHLHQNVWNACVYRSFRGWKCLVSPPPHFHLFRDKNAIHCWLRCLPWLMEMPCNSLSNRTLPYIEGIPYCRTRHTLHSWKVSERLLVGISTRKWRRKSGRKDRLNPKKDGSKLGERIGQTIKFSREFESLVYLKSHFTLTKVRL